MLVQVIYCYGDLVPRQGDLFNEDTETSSRLVGWKEMGGICLSNTWAFWLGLQNFTYLWNSSQISLLFIDIVWNARLGFLLQGCSSGALSCPTWHLGGWADCFVSKPYWSAILFVQFCFYDSMILMALLSLYFSIYWNKSSKYFWPRQAHTKDLKLLSLYWTIKRRWAKNMLPLHILRSGW